MQLLKHSIEEDGYTQPIVAYYDKEKDIYIVVDGFHRYRCAKEYFHLKQVPIVTIDKDLENRMASTYDIIEQGAHIKLWICHI